MGITREEAIDLLDNLIGFVEDNHSSDYDMALKMAIEALKQEPSNVMEHDKDHIWYKGKQYISLSRFLQVKEPCEDAISRQAVLDGIEELKKSPWATDKRGFGFEYLIKEALEVVADLCVKQAPSVNPQESKYCDRNICIKNEYNGIGCDECEVTKSQEPKMESKK